MTRKIVTGVDSSQTALRAAAKAAEVAEGFGAELHVISAYSTRGADSYQPPVQNRGEGSLTENAYRQLTERLAGAAQQVAESVAEALRESHPSLTIQAYAAQGTPADALLRTAEELEADTIVVGNKHVQGVARILGSVARKVASEATCDLYIVNTTQQ